MSMKQCTKWLLGSVLVMSSACSSSGAVRAPLHAPGRLDLTTPFTVAMRSPYGEAYGGAVQLRQHGPRHRPDIDAFLKPEWLLAKTSPALPKHETSSAPATAPARDAVVRKPVLEESAAPANDGRLALSEPTRASSDTERYASRELKSEKQQNFRGGDALVIGAGTLLVVILVVLLIVLLIR